MTEFRPPKVLKFAAQAAVGSLGVALITAACFSSRLRFAIPCLLYLLLVMLQSLWAGFGSSAVVSLIAAFCLDYFFIPPVLTWQIADPEYGVSLLTYLVTSLVITRLASRARDEARTAERRGRDLGLLYEAASQLLSLKPELAVSAESLRIFRGVFGLSSVCFFDASSGELHIEGQSEHGLAEKTRDVCLRARDYQDREQDIRILCLYRAGAVIGAIGFEGYFGDDAIAPPLSVLAATALDRMCAVSSASKADANAQTEMLRSAILDAFAHEFKTPLAIILAATGGLRETGSQKREQIEMTEIIENQTLRLSQLTTRLLRTARLDRDEVTPRMELTSVHALVRTLIEQNQSQYGRGISARLGHQTADIMADPELLGLAFNQLLDNAFKYSLPETEVLVQLGVEDGFADIRVTNEGSWIRPEEREQIFERFVRGSETEHITPGAGLGLYVARKILRAHGGLLELDPRNSRETAATFRMRLPAIRREPGHDQQTDDQSVSSRR